jgi:hypothetical protein
MDPVQDFRIPKFQERRFRNKGYIFSVFGEN